MASARLGMPPCFNGAVTLRSRKLDRAREVGAATFRLQWGRDLAVTETTPEWRQLEQALAASMGP